MEDKIQHPENLIGSLKQKGGKQLSILYCSKMYGTAVAKGKEVDTDCDYDFTGQKVGEELQSSSWLPYSTRQLTVAKAFARITVN